MKAIVFYWIKQAGSVRMKNAIRHTFYLLTFMTFATMTGCATAITPYDDARSPLTHGNVQLTLKRGVTTQQDVLDAFGPPNIMTRDASESEVWTYQKHATVTKSKSSDVYGTIILFGGSSGSSGFEQSSRTMTLIIKFDKSNKVMDFKSMTTSF